MLAPMIRLMPQEMAKNGTAAEKSRMRRSDLETQYLTGRGSQAFTSLAGSLSGEGAKAPLPFAEPHLALPCIAIPHRAGPCLNRLEGGRGARKLLCCRLQLSPCQTVPWLARPELAKSTPKREQQGEPRPSVLPSATIAMPDHSTLCRILPKLTEPCLPSKESSREPFRAQCCRLQL